MGEVHKKSANRRIHKHRRCSYLLLNSVQDLANKEPTNQASLVTFIDQSLDDALSEFTKGDSSSS